MGEPVAATGSNLVHTYQADGRYDQALATTTIPIQQLNEGLLAYQADLLSDSLAMQRVEVSVITFGESVRTICPFVPAYEFIPPTLTAEGATPMGAAVLQAIDAVTARKSWYKQNGLHYYQPIIFLVTDGQPTDDWQRAAELLKTETRDKKLSFFAVGVEGADFGILSQLSPREPVKLRGLDFKPLFLWLSASQRAVSRSNPGQEHPVALPPITWGTL